MGTEVTSGTVSVSEVTRFPHVGSAKTKIMCLFFFFAAQWGRNGRVDAMSPGDCDHIQPRLLVNVPFAKGRNPCIRTSKDKAFIV